MATTNPVFQVLVTKSNQAVLGAGLPVTSLADGQIGVFSAETNLSVDAATTVNNLGRFFIAVGSAVDGSATVNEITKSAGQFIQTRFIKQYTMRCFTPSRPQILDITAFKARCETDYILKIKLTNQDIYRSFGMNAFSKTFSVQSDVCVDDCATCPTADCYNLAISLYRTINADPDGFFTAVFIDYTTTPGTNTVIGAGDEAALATFKATHLTVCPGIRITVNTEALKSFGSINLNYMNPRGVVAEISLLEGFESNGATSQFQELAYSEGEGYDVIQQEYIAGGWNGRPSSSPYRVSDVASMQVNSPYLFADRAGKYFTLNLIYDHESTAGFQEHKANLMTTIAIPCADTVTRNALLLILDQIVSAQLSPLTNDVTAQCSVPGACTAIILTENFAVETDGISNL